MLFLKISVRENFLDKGGGNLKIFRQNFFCLTVPIKFVEELFSVSLFSVFDYIYAEDGCGRIFCRIFLFVSQCRYFSLRNALVFHCFGVSKNVCGKIGER